MTADHAAQTPSPANPLPLALGHEISGHVVAAGEGAAAWMGRAVIVPAVLPCGECDLCRRGLATICRAQKMPGNDIQGGFGSHIVVPARGLCPVDEARLAAAGLTLPQVSIVADALTTPYQAVRRAGVAPGDVAVVVGVGGVGGYCVQIARASGATVVAIDVDHDPAAAVHYDSIGVIQGMRNLPATFTPGPRIGPGLDETLEKLQKICDEQRLAEPITVKKSEARIGD